MIKQDTLDFITKELKPLLNKLDLELAVSLEQAQKKTEELNEEDYYRIIWKVYKLSYLEKRFKDLIYAYKSPELPEEYRKPLKDMIINCNTALILSIMGGLTTDKDTEISTTTGELIAEWYRALTESLEKYEVDFTHEKSTKNVKIKLLGLTEDELLIAIESNKPFWTLDITVKNSLTQEVETINREMVWTEDKNMYLYELHLPFWDLENNYDDVKEKDIKLKVSKKVGHPSTFFTNNIFFALKNYIIKNQLLTINSNSYILKNQVQKITNIYEEKFTREPTDRWLAYYLLIQNSELNIIDDKTLLDYESWLETKKCKKWQEELFNDIDIIIEKKTDSNIVVLKNKEVKRLLMMKNKNATSKNKSTFWSLKTLIWEVTGDEDQKIYEVEFEKRINRKIKEIDKIKHHISGVDSLDRQVWWDDEWSSLADLIWDDSFESEMLDKLDMENYKEQFIELAKRVLTPKEFFYYVLYYRLWLDLKDLWNIWLYQDSSITEVKLIVRKSLAKIGFWSQYRIYIDNN